jgi:isopenicillin-N N-acyltransferase like protein
MIKCYDFSGSAKEIGLQHGESLKREIHELYERLLSHYTDFSPSSDERSIVGFAARYLDRTRKHAPELIEEIEGIAESSGLAFEKVFFMNCYDEMAYYNETKDQVNGCTLFLATGRATADGRTYQGQGWDMDEFFKPVIMRLAGSEEDKRPALVMLTHPGIVGGAGINEHELALTWSTVKATDESTGVPVTLMIRKVLEGKNLNDAVKTLLNTPRASGFNYMVGNRYGGFNIEATGIREEIIYITAIHAHANHYEKDLHREYEIKPPVRSSNTHIRSGRMRQLLENDFGKIDLESCKKMLSDHANYPLGICRHLVPGESDSVTQSALIFIPEEKMMLASDGPPCEQGFELYPLEK